MPSVPAPQTASLEFDVSVRACDQFWNRVDNSSENINIASDDGSLTDTNPLNNNQPLVSGEIIFPLFLTTTGYVTLAGSALDNTDILGQQVVVQVEQGATYQIVTPPAANVGPPSSFSVTISLVDEFGDIESAGSKPEVVFYREEGIDGLGAGNGIQVATTSEGYRAVGE